MISPVQSSEQRPSEGEFTRCDEIARVVEALHALSGRDSELDMLPEQSQEELKNHEDDKYPIAISVNVADGEASVTLFLNAQLANLLEEDFQQSDQGARPRNPEAYRALSRTASSRLEELRRELSLAQTQPDSTSRKPEEMQRELEAALKIMTRAAIYMVRADQYLKRSPSPWTGDVWMSSAR